MSIGKKIKQLRELRNYTQVHLAKEMGLSVGGYNKIETDKTDITLKRLDQIAKILDTDLPTILNFEERQVFNQSNFQDSAIGIIQKQQNFNENGLEEFYKKIKSDIESIKLDLNKSKT